MATTDYPVNSPLAVKRWSEGLMKEALKKTFALQFMGTDSNSLIQIKTELNKGPGDRITFGLRQQLQGQGVQGDGTLEGNEEALVTYTQNVTIDQLRHAVRSSGKMSEQRVPFTIRDEARDGLADWWSDRIDKWFFNQVTGNSVVTDVRQTGMQAATAPDSGHQAFSISTYTAESSFSGSSVERFSLAVIDRAVEKGKLATNYLRPVRADGGEYLVAFLHPTQVTALRQSLSGSTQWADIQKQVLAGGRIDNNPLMTGASGVYNNVIIHESVRVPATLAVGTGSVYRAVLLGAQAATMAFGRGFGKNTFSWKEELFDYENQLGVAGGCVGGLVKTRLNGSDFAAITMSSYEVLA